MNRSDTTVLVTGATGFVAGHCILQLLDAGYSVRGTARSVRRREEVAETLRPHLAEPASLGRLEIVAADLNADAGWDAAAAGCRYVLHVASPLPPAPPKDENELIVPARDGALRVLRAAKAAGAERVVLTSSLAAVLYGVDRRNKVFDESDWSNVDDPRIGAYEKSKTLAERAAWEYAREAGLPLVVINPGLILGPVLGPDLNTSAEAVKKLIDREFPACPDLQYAVVDVRDVAAAHVAAMTAEGAVGERFVCATASRSLREIAAILAQHLGPKGYRIPTARLPNFLMHIVALFDQTARLTLHDLSRPQSIDNAKIKKVLGWKPRDLEEMTMSLATSLIEHGLVKARPR